MGGPANLIVVVALAVVVALIGWQMTKSVRRLQAAQRSGSFNARLDPSDVGQPDEGRLQAEQEESPAEPEDAPPMESRA